ncbi:MAG: hypothetical protein H0U74_01830 [Bradymonadaceae bacterium]|nr:hypothetical protein [Lujinxingiaceae bacterium]
MDVMGAVVAGIAVLMLIGLPIMFAKFYRKVDQGQALIINTLKDVKVSFTGAFILPVIHRAETMDISVKTIEIDRRGKDGLICKDNIRADIKVNFFVRVNQTGTDVLKVAQAVGCARASYQSTLEELFGAKFSEALKTVGKQLDFEELYQRREAFRDEIKRAISDDLNGYSLEDAAIDYLEQTPVSSLDPDNILDAVGIRKITELTAEQRVHTNELSNAAKMRIGKNDLDATMALLEYEKQEADAMARQSREIESVRSREQATAAEIKAQEDARAELARQEAQQVVAVRTINRKREEEVAEKNRERVMAVETENVAKEKAIQIIAREREVALRLIAKDREVETERKNIAEVVRDRIAVDKTVAQEEEYIKDLRAFSDAERTKKTMIIGAEATAQQSLVASIKAAEANEEVAKFEARQRIVMADAELDAADRVAKAKIRTAEGVQAELAADGLARVRVKEADALATEKTGMVDAKLLREKMNAEAAGREQQGLVQIRLKDAMADATEKEGLVEARVHREKMQAEAIGQEDQAMVAVRVKEAGAQAIERQGMAEANVVRERGDADAGVIEKREMAQAVGIREKLLAEAAGLIKKAEAMKLFDEVTRDHEEFRLALEQERVLTTEQLRTSIDIAGHQATILGEAFKAANINIVGGDESFFDRFIGAVSVGKTVDGFLHNSVAAQRVLNRVLDGNGSNEGTNGKGGKAINISAALKELMALADDDKKGQIEALLGQVKDLGLDRKPDTLDHA